MIKTLLFLAVVSLILVTCVSTGSDPNATQAQAFSGYTGWSKVNSEPISGDATGFLGNVHGGPTGIREVFVNPIGKAVSDGEADLPYPKGTILVKESYDSDDGEKGKLKDLTIMVKRESGYDSENGDWEYLSVSATQKIKSQGPIKMCINCHKAAESDDYVFSSNR